MTCDRCHLPKIIWLIVATCGCNSAIERNSASGSLTGKVTLNGQPVKVGTVLMERADHQVALIAPLNSDGRFIAKTMDGKDLPIGEYRLAVSTRRIGETDAGKLGNDFIDAIPAKFHRLDTSGLVVQVIEGVNPPLEIDLKQEAN